MNNLGSMDRQSRSSMTLPCDHCQGLTDHESWCIMSDPKVQYAYAIVNDPCALTYRDSLILHSLGVAWRNRVRETVSSDQGTQSRVEAIENHPPPTYPH